jgi:tetratricopeptide (TPR) repeat protein
MSAAHFYNPDWLDDSDLVRGFAARLEEFAFLRGELVHAPREGNVQHYLLVGLRGTGKTTMLKRLAVAIRQDDDLRDHLLALSFPEELYQVKNLSDFWWAACDALLDELDRMPRSPATSKLIRSVENAKQAAAKSDTKADALSDAGLQCLQQACTELALRPVLLVDNLDMVFERIDKNGRKLKDVHAPAYWAMREALSTTRSPMVIGASVKLSEPFRDVDKAFYDFFIPKRLGKLSLVEANKVLAHLAEVQGLLEIKQRLQQHPSRVETLYDLTGGNPRALGLIFELLRQSPNSRAVEDFERLMDITTPYYKARFEDLAEQAQVVMHALAVCQPAYELSFGLMAAEVAAHASLATGSVSAQLDTLEREGLVEKSAAHGRTQYRISEQLFRLWLQMRGNRRIRQNVLGLTRFLEAMYSLEELQAGINAPNGTNELADARYAFAVADMRSAHGMQRGLEVRGAEAVFKHLKANGGELDAYLPVGDLPEAMRTLLGLREQLRQCRSGLSDEEQEALLGAVKLSLAQKQTWVKTLCEQATPEALTQLRRNLAVERLDLLRDGLRPDDLSLLHHLRTLGCLPLPALTVQAIETAKIAAKMNDKPGVFHALMWRLLGARHFVRITDDNAADAWLDWCHINANDVGPDEWANVAGTLRRSGRLLKAKQALEQACLLGETAHTWFERGSLLTKIENDYAGAELAYRTAIELEPEFAWPWNNLGRLLADKLERHDEAEGAYRKAIELDPLFALLWVNLGAFLTINLNRHDEAELAYRKAIELDPAYALPHFNLALLFTKRKCWAQAVASFACGWTLNTNPRPFWRNQYSIAQTFIFNELAQPELAAGNTSALRAALAQLFSESVNITESLASEAFVENFLAPALAQKQQATLLLAQLRELDFARLALPLALACEAVVANRKPMLAELAPEVQNATRRMYQRLTPSTPKKENDAPSTTTWQAPQLSATIAPRAIRPASPKK